MPALKEKKKQNLGAGGSGPSNIAFVDPELKALAEKAKQKLKEIKDTKKVDIETKVIRRARGGWYCCCGMPICNCGIGPFHWRGETAPGTDDLIDLGGAEYDSSSNIIG